MGSDTVNTSGMTNTELTYLIEDCERKYGKLYKLAERIAGEMDSLSVTYKSAKAEIAKRQNVSGND